jgi:hypothetical protein
LAIAIERIVVFSALDVVSPYLFINFCHTACFRFGVLGKAGLSARLALDTALPKDCALLNGGVCMAMLELHFLLSLKLCVWKHMLSFLYNVFLAKHTVRLLKVQFLSAYFQLSSVAFEGHLFVYNLHINYDLPLISFFCC